jgi:hypothetical protein
MTMQKRAKQFPPLFWVTHELTGAERALDGEKAIAVAFKQIAFFFSPLVCAVQSLSKPFLYQQHNQKMLYHIFTIRAKLAVYRRTLPLSYNHKK